MAIKLIRVHEGIYRTENNGIRVFKRSYENKEHPWVAVWDDIFSCRHQTRFRTLADARKWLEDNA